MSATRTPPQPFVKMHGCGNDFVVMDMRGRDDPMSPALACAIADRRRGVGFDQLILLRDASMSGHAADLDFWNADGSLSAACGNGARCAAALLMDENGRTPVTLKSAAAELHCAPAPDRDGAARIRVNMGPPKLDWREIPIAQAGDTVVMDNRLSDPEAAGLPSPALVNMGNPHVVFFLDDVETAPIERLGPRIETDPMFPERANVSFVRALGRSRLRQRVWERGVGVTLACGSAACASSVAAARRGLADRAVDIEMDGGMLSAEWSAEDDCVYLTGPTREVFRGVFSADFLAQAQADGGADRSAP